MGCTSHSELFRTAFFVFKSGATPQAGSGLSPLCLHSKAVRRIAQNLSHRFCPYVGRSLRSRSFLHSVIPTKVGIPSLRNALGGATPPSVLIFGTLSCAEHRHRFQEHSFATRHNQTSCPQQNGLLSCSRRPECGYRFGRGSNGRG